MEARGARTPSIPLVRFPIDPRWARRWPAALAIVTLLLISASLTTAAIPPADLAAEQSAASTTASQGIRDDVEAFQLLTKSTGWLQRGGRLYRTDDGGQTWREITPAVKGSVTVTHFLDGKRAWVVLADGDAATYSLARTEDGGVTWSTAPLDLAALGPTAPPAEPAYLYFADGAHGWLVVKQLTSSNFSLGTLYATDDGGKTWHARTIPIAEPVYFANASLGWVAGGPAGDELYRTRDGGQTWEAQKVAVTGRQQVYYRLPRVDADGKGLLPVIIGDGDESKLELYSTRSAGDRWEALEGVDVGRPLERARYLPVDVVDSNQWVVVEPDDRNVGRTAGNASPAAALSTDGATAGIVEISMATAEVGWARDKVGKCEALNPTGQDLSVECTSSTRLLGTVDGGKTWKGIVLPAPIETDGGAGSRSVTVSSQGFDTCEIPSLAALNTWILYSPYRTVNLYFGGSSQSCPNARLTASYLSELTAQGWSFIPTWVGPQAPCLANRKTHFSYEPATAYAEGIREADLASDRLTQLGFPTGTVAYYDLEAYSTSNSACRDAAKAFMTGWTTQIHARGNLSGVYGASCGSAMTDLTGTAAEPDQAWLSWRSYLAYTSDVPLFGSPCLSDDFWSNHQRLRQYAASHLETWGGVTINIDSDVLDGATADRCGPGTDVPCEHDSPNLSGPENGFVATAGQTVQLVWTPVADVERYRVEAWNESVDGVRIQVDTTGDSYTFVTNSPGVWRWQVGVLGSDGSLGPISASRTLTVQPAPADWQVEFFADSTLTRPCHSETLTTTYIFENWPTTPGGSCPAEGFSARLTRRVTLQSARYLFALAADGKARLKLDGVTLLDSWTPEAVRSPSPVPATFPTGLPAPTPSPSPTATPTPANPAPSPTLYGEQDLAAGEHTIEVDFLDVSGPARLYAYWSGPGFDLPNEPRAATQWFAEYWPNGDLQGDPVVRKNEGTGYLAKSWGDLGPGYGIAPDRFSARFTRTVTFPCGLYRLVATADDGVRVRMNGTLVLDGWRDQAATTYESLVRLDAGDYTFDVAYYQHTGQASLALRWALVSACPLAPSSPSPQIGQTDVSLGPTLSWRGGDPEGEPVTYDVYLDPAPPGSTSPVSPQTKVCEGTATYCDPLAFLDPSLDHNLWPATHYYWQVKATDSQGNVTLSPVFDFVTMSAYPDGEYQDTAYSLSTRLGRVFWIEPQAAWVPPGRGPAGSGRVGSITTTRVPPPGGLSSSMLPPCRRTISWLT